MEAEVGSKQWVACRQSDSKIGVFSQICSHRLVRNLI